VLKPRPPLPNGLAIITVLKGMIGTGVLGLPYVCGKVGLALATPGMLLTALIGAFSVWRLIQCKEFIKTAARYPISAELVREFSGCGRKHNGQDYIAAEIPEPVFESDSQETYGLGPLAVVGRRAFGGWGVAIAGFGIIASQLGFALSYVAVVVETAISHEPLKSLEGGSALARTLLCMVLCILCTFRRLSTLAWFSGAALLIYIYLLGALIYFGGGELSSGAGVRGTWLPIKLEHLGSWFGTAIFAQEAIVISQYVYDDMQLSRPVDFLPVLLSSFGISATLFTFVGAFGYLCYGSDIQQVFYLNFPEDSIAVVVGEVVLCVVLVFSFALQMYPVMSFMEASLFGIYPGEGFEEQPEEESESEGSQSPSSDSSGSSDSSDRDRREPNTTRGHREPPDQEMLEYSFEDPLMTAPIRLFWRCMQGLCYVLFRWIVVIATCVAAAFIPNLSCVSGYSGSFAMSAIGFFLPALCHHRLKPGIATWKDNLGNLILLMAGISAVYFGVSSVSCD